MRNGRLLVPGIEISSWAEAKYQRAEFHFHELSYRIGAWQMDRPLRTTARLSDDETAIEYHLDIHATPPVSEIATITGDGFHCLRNSLDAMVFALATMNGNDPDRPHLIDFPMVLKSGEWARAKAKLTDLPQSAVDLIESWQPYNAPAGHFSSHQMLHLLDIRDKHKTSIVVKPGPLELRVHASGAKLLDPATVIKVEVPSKAPDFENGALVGREQADRKIALGETPGIATCMPVWVLEWGGLDVSLVDVVQELAAVVRISLDALYGGKLPDAPFPWLRGVLMIEPDEEDLALLDGHDPVMPRIK